MMAVAAAMMVSDASVGIVGRFVAIALKMPGALFSRRDAVEPLCGMRRRSRPQREDEE